MAGSWCAVQSLALCVWLCAFSHAVPKWSDLPQNPQALMFQQTDQRFQKPVQQQASQWFPQQVQKPVQQQASQWSPQQFPQSVQQQASQQFPQQFQPKQPVAQAEPLDKCTVADYEQIQCGPPGISGAECAAINCCFDGQQCYYGKAGKSVVSVEAFMLNWSSAITCSCNSFQWLSSV